MVRPPRELPNEAKVRANDKLAPARPSTQAPGQSFVLSERNQG